MNNFEVIIGIEIHCELKTATKMFSSAPVNSESKPNTNVNEIDLAHPGTLPSVNKEAVKLAIKACSTMQCEIDPILRFDRKNYYYSDLPKGFQITQQFYPIGKNGEVEIEVNNEVKKIRINRIHLEEDTAKQYHQDATYIDYNRAGTPLIEIVSEADIRSAQEASAYVEAIRSMLFYLNVSDVKMEEGSLRCDVNISLRPFGYEGYGNKVEIKNLNSISNVAKAIEFEIKRQSEMILNNEEISQETRRYDENSKSTVLMRKKEGAIDYKYFPEPNILPTIIDTNWIENIILNMEELPKAKKHRYMNEYGLSKYDSDVLVSNKQLATLFDETIQHTNQFKYVVNWITQDFSAALNKDATSKIDPTQLAILVEKIASNEVSSKQAKQIFEQLLQNVSFEKALASIGGTQISDEGIIIELVTKVLSENNQSIEDYKNGKDRALKYLVGQLMKESKGKVNPKIATDLLLKYLNKC